MLLPTQKDLQSEIGPDIRRYYQAANAPAEERIRLFRLAWEIACSSFGGRQVLYERYFAGDFYRNVANHYTNHDKRPYRELVEAFLARDPAPLPEAEPVDSAARP